MRSTQGRGEDGFWCDLPVVRVVWSLGGGGFSAALEPVALTVHLQDVDVVGSRSSRAPVRRSEPNTSVLLCIRI